MLKGMVDKIVANWSSCGVCQKGIDDIAQHYLAKANILTVRRVKESDMTSYSQRTGASIVTTIEDLTAKDLWVC